MERLSHAEKFEILEDQLRHQRTNLMLKVGKKTIGRQWAMRRIGAWVEIVEDFQTLTGEVMSSERITQLEERVAILESLIGAGEKLIRMKGSNYIVPPDTMPWKAWHRRFIEMNDPRIYKTGELEVPSIWPPE